jgi:L-malate glycosyltransferase
MGIHQKIAVCHVISGDLWAGAEAQVCSLLKSLKVDQSVAVSVIAMNEGRLAEFFRRESIPVTVIAESENGFLGILERVAAELSGRKIDIIHSHRYKENLLAVLLKNRRRVEHLVQTVHGNQERCSGYKGLKIRLYGFLNDYASRRFDRIIAVSNDIRRQRVDHLGQSKIVTIHNAIDISQVAPSRPPGEVRRELGIEKGQRVIGAVGRMVPVKGFDQFLSAARIIAEQRSDVVFLLVGDGPKASEYGQMVLTLGLKGKVRQLGFRDDIWDIVNCLDLFVMTSHHEGIPLILLEAMALKRPVVAMSAGGIPEIIEPEVSGILVEPGDVESTAAACLEVLAHSDRAKALGDGARRRVESEFAMDVHRDRVLALYKDVVGYG